MQTLSLTLQLVGVPFEIFQLVTHRPVYPSIVISHAVSVGLLLQELRAKGQCLNNLRSRVHTIFESSNMRSNIST